MKLKMKLTNTRYFLWLLVLLLAVPAAVAADDDAARAVRADHVPGQVLVKFTKGASPRSILAAAKGVGAKHLRSFASIGVRHWRLGRGLSVEKALKILAKRKNVEYAEPNYIVTADDFKLPDDPRRGDLWGMHNLGQSGGTADADIDAPEAWFIRNDATDVIVGVIDTGIDYTHEDLAANMWVNELELNGEDDVDDDDNGVIDDIHGANFIGDGDPTGDPMDDNGHGSHTAGTIGAVGNNGKGVAGVCWNVKLMALKFLNAGGRGNTADALEAVLYATEMGARVTNNSWGGGHRSKAFEAAVKASGALFVASAGNSGSSRKQYPASMALDNVIAVAATDHNDELASFSNYGSWVHLAAPGVDTVSCILNDKYGKKSGTSMSCPHVAGAAALTIAHLGLSNAETKSALLGGVDPIPGLADAVSSGGRLNLFTTLGGVPIPPEEEDVTAPAAVGNLVAGSPTPWTLTLSWTATGDDGSDGSAMLYDVRYSTEAISDTTWDAATQASGEPLPSMAGSLESFELSGLEPVTDYYFALKVLDEVGNTSGLSNSTRMETLPGPWATESVDTSGSYYKALDFHDGAGDFSIGCAHSDEDTVVAVLFDTSTGEWQREVVDPDSRSGAGIDFAFAPDGTPTVSYGWGKIRFAWRQLDGTWKVESIEKGRANNDYTALVYDPNSGEPTVAYRKGSNLRFARKVGGYTGTWKVETVEKAGARYQDMVYNKDGNPVIAYSDDHNDDGWLSALKVATLIDGSWVIETLHEGETGYGVYASIAVDADGDLLVADAGYSHVIAFRKPDGTSSWAGIEAEDVVDGGGIHAAFDTDGTPYICYGRGGKTFVAFQDGGAGTAWKTEQVASTTSARMDISVDPSGGLGVLYGQRSGGVGLGRKP